MLPDFFDLFSIDARGLTFERVFWILIALIGIVACVREIRLKRPLNDSWLGWMVGVGLTAFGTYWAVQVFAFNHLYFGTAGLSLSTYGLTVAVSFILGIYLSFREARRSAAPPTGAHVFDLAFWVLLASMVGSRLLFVAVSWETYYNLCFEPELIPGSGGQADCWAAFKFWKGGLVFFGGFIGAILAGVSYCLWNKIGFLRAADVALPSVAIGHFFGRLGCITAGCCFGRPCDLPWGIYMPEGSAAFDVHIETFGKANPDLVAQFYEQGHSLAIHPTQLYEASGELLIFILLIFLRGRRQFYGQILATWLICYGVLRFVVELFRGDKIRGFLTEVVIPPVNNLLGFAPDEPTLLSTSQAISILILVGGVAVYFVGRALDRRHGSPSEASQV